MLGLPLQPALLGFGASSLTCCLSCACSFGFTRWQVRFFAFNGDFMAYWHKRADSEKKKPESASEFMPSFRFRTAVRCGLLRMRSLPCCDA